MRRRPPSSTLTYTLCPYTTLFRSLEAHRRRRCRGGRRGRCRCRRGGWRRGRCWRGRRCRAGSIRDFAAEVTDQAPEAAGKALRDRAATPTGAMTIEFDHHYGLLVRQMLCDVELGFALVECDGQRPRFRDGAVVVGCGENDAVDG